MQLIKLGVVSMLATVSFDQERTTSTPMNITYRHEDVALVDESMDGIPSMQSAQESTQPFTRDGEKVGRNQPCPCGSGKKFKHCHGVLV